MLILFALLNSLETGWWCLVIWCCQGSLSEKKHIWLSAGNPLWILDSSTLPEFGFLISWEDMWFIGLHSIPRSWHHKIFTVPSKVMIYRIHYKGKNGETHNVLQKNCTLFFRRKDAHTWLSVMVQLGKRQIHYCVPEFQWDVTTSTS